MTATVINLTSRRNRHRTADTPPVMTVPAVAWWHCPYWCMPDQCRGGESFDFGNGPTTATSRTHTGVILSEQVPSIDGGHATVLVEITTTEDHDDGFVDGVHINVQADFASTNLDALARIADAIQAAVYHARQPLPVSPRPSSRVAASDGGRATNLPTPA